MKKYSFLSLALIGASGITAAFLPAKKAEAKSNGQQALNGKLVVSTGTATKLTCTDLVATVQDCDWSATLVDSGTTDGQPNGITSATTPLTEFGSPNPTYTAGYTTTQF